jgi:hypothetical protein
MAWWMEGAKERIMLHDILTVWLNVEEEEEDA